MAYFSNLSLSDIARIESILEDLFYIFKSGDQVPPEFSTELLEYSKNGIIMPRDTRDAVRQMEKLRILKDRLPYSNG